NTTAVDLSLALLREEVAIWAQAQGANEGEVGAHAKIAAFRETWSLALDPPPPMDFKNRTELAELHIAKEKLPRTAYNPQLHRIIEVSSHATFVDMVSQSREIATEYFKQFDDYI